MLVIFIESKLAVFGCSSSDTLSLLFVKVISSYAQCDVWVYKPSDTMLSHATASTCSRLEVPQFANRELELELVPFGEKYLL
jgi:hypothetical protein